MFRLRLTLALVVCCLVAPAAWAEASTYTAPQTPARALDRLRVHVDGVLRSKCRAVYPIVTPALRLPPAWRSVVFRRWQLRHRQAHRLSSACQASGLAAAWAWYHRGDTQCEVSHEGGWTSVSSGGTYAGRFQMDYGFETSKAFGRSMERRYGRANAWPPWAQVYHAYEVWLDRGWSPWPPYYVYGCAGQ